MLCLYSNQTCTLKGNICIDNPCTKDGDGLPKPQVGQAIIVTGLGSALLSWIDKNKEFCEGETEVVNVIDLKKFIYDYHS